MSSPNRTFSSNCDSNSAASISSSCDHQKLRNNWEIMQRNSFLLASGFSGHPPHPLSRKLFPSRDASDDSEKELVQHLVSSILAMVHYTLTHHHPRHIPLNILPLASQDSTIRGRSKRYNRQTSIHEITFLIETKPSKVAMAMVTYSLKT